MNLRQLDREGVDNGSKNTPVFRTVSKPDVPTTRLRSRYARLACVQDTHPGMGQYLVYIPRGGRQQDDC
jgi:hypothetical protein